jgi:hypothetical protein
MGPGGGGGGGVAETTPNGLGVVSATTLGPGHPQYPLEVVSVTPLGTKGWLGHPHGPNKVAKTISKPPLGVVSVTPLAPWGWLWGFFFFSFFFFFFFFFFEKIYIYIFSDKKFN